jgi:hypothetical protein
MSSDSPERADGKYIMDRVDATPSGIILERFKRMRHLPPHTLDLEDEFFVQNFLRRKRTA